MSHTVTLAAKLGTTTHISALLRKAWRLGLDAEGLEKLAVQRLSNSREHRDLRFARTINFEQFSNEELAIALLNPALRYDPQTVRLGAAMLNADGNKPETIAWLAKLELNERVVRYAAECGNVLEPLNQFWLQLLALLPETRPPKAGVLPDVQELRDAFERAKPIVRRLIGGAEK